ncbi:MAG: DUF4058 family protein [Cyanobacteria bacterium J06639_18]
MPTTLNRASSPFSTGIAALMQNPFPGMNPYLEQSGLWLLAPEFRTRPKFPGLNPPKARSP